MRWINASLWMVLYTALLTACASQPQPAQNAASSHSYWITDPHYWENADQAAGRAAHYAAAAGHDPNEAHRSAMIMACSQRQRPADARERSEADADCAALAALPPTSTTDCRPNSEGGVSCTTH